LVSESPYELVIDLTSQFGRPVIDKTGLTGKFDFVLKYKGRWDSDRPTDDSDLMPPLDRALQEELGLKVEAGKGTDKVLVIDHVEKPSDSSFNRAIHQHGLCMEIVVSSEHKLTVGLNLNVDNAPCPR
jgi:hypothetical protein